MRSFIIKNILLALTALFSGCTNVFLQPDRVLYMNPDNVGLKWEEVHFKADGGPELSGLWFPSAKPKTKGVVIQFHGNGENMTSHFLYVYWMALEGWDVLAFDYRGYGGSFGIKDLDGSIADGAAALAFARTKAPGLPLVVIGQSLGGALSLASLQRDGGAGLRALVLDSTFASYRRVARGKLSEHWATWPLQPLAYALISDRLAPEGLVMRRPPVPLLMMHARADPIVPFDEGRRLYALAPDPKTFWNVPGKGHIEALSLYGAEFRPKLLRFLDDALKN